MATTDPTKDICPQTSPNEAGGDLTESSPAASMRDPVQALKHGVLGRGRHNRADVGLADITAEEGG